tara:strand:- start:627 stop:782 length:156 start_codon:yes stop_codon:yes gene_type:complete
VLIALQLATKMLIAPTATLDAAVFKLLHKLDVPAMQTAQVAVGVSQLQRVI